MQRIIGHASVAFTLDVYGHLYPDEMDTWAGRLDGQLRAERGQGEREDDDRTKTVAASL